MKHKAFCISRTIILDYRCHWFNYSKDHFPELPRASLFPDGSFLDLSILKSWSKSWPHSNSLCFWFIRFCVDILNFQRHVVYNRKAQDLWWLLWVQTNETVLYMSPNLPWNPFFTLTNLFLVHSLCNNCRGMHFWVCIKYFQKNEEINSTLMFPLLKQNISINFISTVQRRKFNYGD